MALIDDPFEQAKGHFFAALGRQQAGDFAAAEQHYRASLALVPGRPSTLINLAAVQLRLARPGDALQSADAALAVERDSVDAWLHRGTALAQLGRAGEALAAFQRLLAVDGHHAAAWSASGTLLREMQRFDEAAHAFGEALRHGAEGDLHQFYLASVGAGAAPAAPPREYVAGLFDGYADDFDSHLVGELRYQAHRQLVDLLVARAGGDARWQSALDLGCGTGLCGPLVKPRVGRLTGVDLSARMIEKARALDVYDRLAHADIVEFLAQSDERWDLVLAADVFIYVGDLAPVFASLERAMARGMFCFSVEALDDGDADLRLLPSLRYAHSKAYLARLAALHGFAVEAMEQAPVREDQGEAVEGLYVVLRRVAG
ncbi:MAG: methyltransferase domain-containing protein [Caldimonas sp.]